MCCAAIVVCRQPVLDSWHSSLPFLLMVPIPFLFAKCLSSVLVALPLGFAAISCAVGYLKRQLGLTGTPVRSEFFLGGSSPSLKDKFVSTIKFQW